MYSEHIELLNFNGGDLGLRVLFIRGSISSAHPAFNNSMALSGNSHLFGKGELTSVFSFASLFDGVRVLSETSELSSSLPWSSSWPAAERVRA